MKKRHGLILLLCFLFCGTVRVAASEDTAEFEKANAAYQGGRFDEAVRLYEGLAQRRPSSAGIFYNLGNSDYRSKKIGEAILAYERARLIEPRNADIRQNLSYVRGLLEYRIEDKRNWYLKAAERMLEYFTEKEIGLLWLGSLFLFLASWAFVLYFRRGAPWDAKRKTLLVLTLLFAVLAFAKNVETNVLRDAIVTVPNAEIRYGPSGSDQIAFRLGEGLKVYVVERRPEWSRVVLVNGESGWVLNNQIAEIRMPR